MIRWQSALESSAPSIDGSSVIGRRTALDRARSERDEAMAARAAAETSAALARAEAAALRDRVATLTERVRCAEVARTEQALEAGRLRVRTALLQHEIAALGRELMRRPNGGTPRGGS